MIHDSEVDWGKGQEVRTPEERVLAALLGWQQCDRCGRWWPSYNDWKQAPAWNVYPGPLRSPLANARVCYICHPKAIDEAYQAAEAAYRERK